MSLQVALSPAPVALGRLDDRAPPDSVADHVVGLVLFRVILFPPLDPTGCRLWMFPVPLLDALFVAGFAATLESILVAGVPVEVGQGLVLLAGGAALRLLLELKRHNSTRS